MTRLSHYTSLEGLQGIASSHCLHATEFLHLNDTSELTYGMSTIWRKALEKVEMLIPPDQRNDISRDSVLAQIPDMVSMVRTQMMGGDGYDNFYVTSFARSPTAFDEEQGLLTLWREYTRTRGFCLQYDRRKIEDILSTQRTMYNFAILQLVDVIYGINSNDRELQWLVDQFSLVLLRDLAITRNDTRFMENTPRPAVESEVTRRILLFCASHKSEAFADEREVRIFAMPLRPWQPIPFALHRPKPINTNPINGKRYITFGEGRTPAFRPDKIIIGPNACMVSDDVRLLFPETFNDICPRISKSTITVANPAA